MPRKSPAKKPATALRTIKPKAKRSSTVTPSILKDILAGRGKASRYPVNDGTGLVLIVTNTQSYWLQNLRLNGETLTKTIGHYPTLSLTDAQRLARCYKDLKNMGYHPFKTAQEMHLENEASVEYLARIGMEVARQFHAVCWDEKGKPVPPNKLPSAWAMFLAPEFDRDGNLIKYTLSNDLILKTQLALNKIQGISEARTYRTKRQIDIDMETHQKQHSFTLDDALDNVTPPVLK